MKKTFAMNKLIRDKSYEQILTEGGAVEEEPLLSPKEALKYLKEKIVEEAQEVTQATTEEHLIEELSDCLEVLHAFMDVLQHPFSKLEAKRQEKRHSRGGFSGLHIVKSVTIEENHSLAHYCKKHPDKYPEIKKT